MDAFSLKATLGLDSSAYEKGLDRAKNIAGSIFNGVKTVAKVGTAAIGAASAAVTALTVNSVKSYADYEQLVGGVQKLYGNMGQSLEEYAKSTGKSVSEVKTEWSNLEKAQNMVLDNAKNAYKTAGMSANQYMDMATSFSASLINSLGGDTVKAAEQTDVAMRAISDNFNTFGGDISMIQGAFQGFAKQNYTMLDNLKLGYGGTKTEMERLISDANEYAASIGEASDLSIESFSDIVTAIELVQKKQNIWGTTAREASTTMAGSIGMAKAAWQNLVTGFADGNADMDKLVSNLVDSVAGYTDEMGEHVNGVIDNPMPAIEKALIGIGQAIERIAPVLSEKIPSIITNLLPPLLNAATTLLQGLVSAFPSFRWVFFDIVREVDVWLEQLIAHVQAFDWVGAATNLMEYITSCFKPDDSALASMGANALTLVESLVQGITQTIPILISAAMDLIAQFGNFLADRAPSLIDTAVDLVVNLAKGLTNPTSLSNMLTSALNLIMSLAQGLINNIPKITATVPQIIENLMQTIARLAPRLLVSALQLIIQLEIGLIKNIPTLLAAVPQIIGSLVVELINAAGELIRSGAEMIENVKQGFESLNPAEWGRDLIDSFVEGIRNSIGKVVSAAKEVAGTVKDYLGFSEPELGPLSNFHTYAPDMMELFAKGIKDNTNIVANQMEKSFALPDMSNDISGSTNSVTGGNVIINVYGAEGQSEKLLAEEVADLLLHDFNMKQAVWGTT